MNTSAKQNPLLDSLKDYYELCKPNVVLLMLLTAVVGMYMAVDGDASVSWSVLIYGNLGIALCAASAAVINHLVDQHIDQEMARTENRPVATGRIPSGHAIIFAVALTLVGSAILYFKINTLTLLLTLASSVGYAFIYTMYLKRATPQNIVIGGLAGAMPPLLGWTAVSNAMPFNAWILVFIIFAWTPPHFWALAIHRKEEYAKVNIPMLPVTHGEAHTRKQILIYTIVMVIGTLLPYFTGLSGLVYLISALILGAGFLACAIALLDPTRTKLPMFTFAYSIVYLALLFIAMLIDHRLF